MGTVFGSWVTIPGHQGLTLSVVFTEADICGGEQRCQTLILTGRTVPGFCEVTGMTVPLSGGDAKESVGRMMGGVAGSRTRVEAGGCSVCFHLSSVKAEKK